MARLGRDRETRGLSARLESDWTDGDLGPRHALRHARSSDHDDE